MPCFKYFINRSVCLQQYREALKVCYSFPEKDLRDQMIDMMRHEFEPLLKFRTCFDPDDKV